MIPTIPEWSTTTLPQQNLPVAIAPSSLEVDFQDEFIEELIEGSYKSLRHCLSMIFKSIYTSFASWRSILFRAIESIRDVGGVTEVKSFEELIDNLEKDICDGLTWGNTPLVEAEQERLLEQIKGII